MFLRLLRLQTDAVQLALDAGSVIAERLDDMTDLSPAAAGERTRMITEKHTAFAAAGFDAAAYMMRGAHPVVVMEAALRPIRETADANRTRLGRRR